MDHNHYKDVITNIYWRYGVVWTILCDLESRDADSNSAIFISDSIVVSTLDP